MKNSTNTKPLKVFLCHSNEDKSAVRVLYQDLRKDGFDPWLDEEKLLPGQDWDLEIKKAERDADVILVCISNLSAQKEGYVQKEIKFALDIADEKPDGVNFIIPARLEPCNLPSKLSRWHWVDIFNPKGYPKLKEALRFREQTLTNSSKMTDGVDSQPETNNEKRIEQLNNLYNNQSTLLGQVISLVIFLGLVFIDNYILSLTLSSLGIIGFMPTYLVDLDPGILILSSIFLPQVSALFLIFETYGISKLTGYRFRISSLKVFRTLAWMIIIFSSVCWISIGINGLRAGGLLTTSINPFFQTIISYSFFSIPAMNVALTALFFLNEAFQLPITIIEYFKHKKIFITN